MIINAKIFGTYVTLQGSSLFSWKLAFLREQSCPKEKKLKLLHGTI